MKRLCIGVGIFVFSVSVLSSQTLPLPPVPRGPAAAANGLEVGSATKHDVSPPLRAIAVKLPSAPISNQESFRGRPHPNPKSTSPDAAVQASSGPKVGTTAGLNVLGVGQSFVGPAGTFQVHNAPPDTNGAVGATQYVQWVNTSFAVFDKATGNPVYGPAHGNTLWTGFGGGCENNNDGDPIAQYDKRANRWIMAQPVFTAPYMFCIAVSTSSDATGTYNRYSFAMPNFPDYPKLAQWPGAYFASFNMFNGNTFLGARACAFDSASMIAGGAATFQCAQLSSVFDSLLPSDLDGSIDPPSPAPNFFIDLGTNSLNVWQFHADFVTPANATFVGPSNIPVASFSDACPGGSCIPQSGTTQPLDGLGDRLMYRLAYRAFSTYQSLVAVHSVTVGTHVGLRWYELRTSGGSTPSLFQQGTYSPDSNFRWMGSIGMDQAGDIALGYSVSSAGMHPAIRYTGRISTDTLGTLQTENSIIEGGGSQLTNLDRWGDYSSINIDPTDDCTFWYSTEYLQNNGTFNWSTRIASFKFPNCAPANMPPSAVSVSPSSGSGSSQLFSFTYSDPNGSSDLNLAVALFNTSVNLANGCAIAYVRGSNQLFLQNDAGTAWLGPGTPGTAGTLQNNQCSLNLQTSSVSPSGLNLTLNLALTFKPAFLGTQSIFMYAADNAGLNSGWQTRGTWSVTPAVEHPPQAVSVTPSSGSGSNQVFALLYSDPDGFADLNTVFVVINTTLSVSNGCIVAYVRSSNQLLLLDNAGTSWGTGTPGSAGSLQNSQCTLNLATSSVSTSGTNLTLNLALAFTSAFLGTQNIFMYATDTAGQNSGWQTRGTWTVTPAVEHPPQAVSVMPSSGSGSSQVFTLLYSDPDGVADLDSALVVINTALSAANGCFIDYVRASNQLFLVDDSGTMFLGPVTPGTAGTLQNSQCTLNVQTSSASPAGTNLTLNLALTFKPAFTGTKSVFMYASDNSGQNSGWQTRGAWTVP